MNMGCGVKNSTVFCWEVAFACVHFSMRESSNDVSHGHQTEHGCVKEDVRDSIAGHLRSFVAVVENIYVTSVNFVPTLFYFDPTSVFCLFVLL